MEKVLFSFRRKLEKSCNRFLMSLQSRLTIFGLSGFVSRRREQFDARLESLYNSLLAICS